MILRARQSRIAVALLALALAGAAWAGAAEPWRVEGAPVRFRVRITEPPSHASAGLIVRIPDAGILPRPNAGPVVVDDNGMTLKSACLWHDPDQALVLLFATPAAGKAAWVYVRKAMTRPAGWTPASGLTPSVIAYTRPGTTNIADAQRLEKDAPPGKGVYIEFPETLSMGGLPAGLDGPFVDYLVAHLAVTGPGKTWFAPEVTGNVAMETLVDGKRLTPKKAFEQLAGSTGGWQEVPKGLCRIEMFGSRPAMDSRFQLTWKPPHTDVSELGGANPVRRGMSMWAARPIKPAECVRSGKAEIVDAQFADGTPVPVISVTPAGYVWLDDQALIRYRVEAKVFGGTTDGCTWTFDRTVRMPGLSPCQWLFVANRDCRVEFTVPAGRTTRTMAYGFRSFCSGALRDSLNAPAAEENYRAALLTMIASLPADGDPTAAWPKSLWDLFYRVLDPIRSRPLLTELFKERWRAIAARIDDEHRAIIEAMYFDALVAADPKRAMARVLEMERSDPRRARFWQLKRADLHLYHTGDLAAAEKLILPLAVQATAPDRRAQVRLGDLALLKGDYAGAMRAYGAVQNAVIHVQEAAETAKMREPKGRRPRRAPPPPAAAEDWRVGAIRDTAVSENARALLRQDRLREAKDAIEKWELEFPMSKLSSDYLVIEAKVYAMLGDPARGARALGAYCRSVESASCLPEAMTTALACMISAGATDEELNAFTADMKSRLKNHPLGSEADEILARLKKEGAVGR